MTTIRKVITKADAVAEAYYIAQILTKEPDHPANADIRGVWLDEEWKGNWKDTDYLISGPDFEVGASRMKHRDGRIRDASNTLENGLAFALFCVEHFPLRNRSVMWAERLLDKKLVLGTLDRNLRTRFNMPTSVTVSNLKSEYRTAIVLSTLSE